ncbi:MAG: sodium-dependent bicarbonate transport family permease [Actinomycetes bacterium]
MDINSLSLAAGNLVSVPVLAFLLGLLAAGLRADLRLPDAAYQAISIYLLFAIGLKGGVALRQSNPGDVIGPVIAALVLGLLIPLAAFWVLRVLTPLAVVDRGAVAAHYGSTSLVTFTAALVFLESAGISYEGFMATLLTVLEIPGIIVGLMLAGRARGSQVEWRESLGAGPRNRRVSEAGGGNVRVEVLATAEVVDRMWSALRERYFPQYAVVAWEYDVNVERGELFGS